MANPEHLEILKQGVEVWNQWREENREIRPDLRDVNLNGANLRNFDLFEAKLRRTELRGARLNKAELSNADLSLAIFIDADLHEAKLMNANLTNSYLHGTNLRSADLTSANLRGAYVYKVDLSGTTIGLTTFGNIDLSNTKGLQDVIHEYPSTIGIDTIYRSKGKIPETFLRGCGVPEDMIDFVRIMNKQAIDFYSCFISYSSKDEDFAKHLHADLQQNAVRVWFAPEDMKGGKKIHEQIENAIKTHDKLILVLSPDSMQSGWVRREIRNAYIRQLEEGRHIFFPVRLCSMDEIKEWDFWKSDLVIDFAEEIREYYIPDFSNWKDHDSFQTAFERLLADLRSSEQSDRDDAS